MVVRTPAAHEVSFFRRFSCFRIAIVVSSLLSVVYFALLLASPELKVLIQARVAAAGVPSEPAQPLTFSAPVQQLLSDLKAATRTATQSGGSPVSYTEQEKEAWTRSHPCRARAGLPKLFARKHVTDVQPNHQWEAVLKEYAVLHGTCIRKIGNLTEHFLSQSSVPGCKFVTGESLFGLGNKIGFAASIVLYGILTQRVVLFYEWASSVPSVMCEPFEGSSWKLPYSLEYLNKREVSPHNVNKQAISNSTAEFLAWVDREKATGSNHRELAEKTLYFTEVDDGWHPVDRFFCDSEQQFLSQVDWISFAGCLYFLPKLFMVPLLRPTLEALFPDRMALTHVLRSVFLPYNVAWDRIHRNYEMFLGNADKLVSIQVRYRNGIYEQSQLHEFVNRHTIQCLLENGILPNVSNSGVYDLQEAESEPSITKVLITSLHTDLHDLLADTYLRNPTETAESVGFTQLTHDDDQQWGLEADRQALVEIVLLSLADHMLVTPLSTFGGIAQAYGGLKPWIVEHSKGSGSCVRASSVDLCYQRATETMSCPHELHVHNRKVVDLVPYLKNCLEIDSPDGVLLITN